MLMATIIIALATSCSHQKKYVIGVAQCSEDSWRHKLNAELQAAAYFHPNVELRFANANDDVQLQRRQLLQFARDGVDMIIVAPITSREITPAIEQVMDRGIPVITFDRKTHSNRYTAYIGCDNYQMGYTMGKYVAGEMHQHGKVVEITGMQGSSPMIERHRGFAAAIKQYPGITIIATALIDTGSKMDEVIFEEFKGTGNMELQLDRMLSNKRIFPAVNLIQSSTRRDDLLHDETTLKRMWILRNFISEMNPIEAMNTVRDRLIKTRNNEEFLLSMND